jgi:hypothetical protein
MPQKVSPMTLPHVTPVFAEHIRNEPGLCRNSKPLFAQSSAPATQKRRITVTQNPERRWGEGFLALNYSIPDQWGGILVSR